MNRERGRIGRAVTGRLALSGAVLLGITAAMAEELVDPATYPALQCVLATAADHNVALAIDPDVIPALMTIRTRFDGSPVRPDLDKLVMQLQSHEMAIVPVQLTPKLRIQFLTARATVVYCAAVGHLQRGDAATARRVLDANFCNQCEFAAHCRALRSALDELTARRHALACLALEARQSIEKLGVARSAVTTATSASLSHFRGSESVIRLGPDLKVAFEASSRAIHVQELRRAGALLERMRASAAQAGNVVMPRVREAAGNGLLTEARHLADALAGIHARHESLRVLLHRQGAGIGTEAQPAVPSDLATMCVQLRQSHHAASSCVRVGIVSIDNGQEASALRHFAKAFAADRADPLARIGFGYCLFQKYGMELGPYCPELMPSSPDAASPARVAGNEHGPADTAVTGAIVSHLHATR